MRLYLISWFDDGEGGLHWTVFEGDQCAIILQPVVPLFYYLNWLSIENKNKWTYWNDTWVVGILEEQAFYRAGILAILHGLG